MGGNAGFLGAKGPLRPRKGKARGGMGRGGGQKRSVIYKTAVGREGLTPRAKPPRKSQEKNDIGRIGKNWIFGWGGETATKVGKTCEGEGGSKWESKQAVQAKGRVKKTEKKNWIEGGTGKGAAGNCFRPGNESGVGSKGKKKKNRNTL